jgi:hypothetical protein
VAASLRHDARMDNFPDASLTELAVHVTAVGAAHLAMSQSPLVWPEDVGRVVRYLGAHAAGFLDVDDPTGIVPMPAFQALLALVRAVWLPPFVVPGFATPAERLGELWHVLVAHTGLAETLRENPEVVNPAFLQAAGEYIHAAGVVPGALPALLPPEGSEGARTRHATLAVTMNLWLPALAVVDRPGRGWTVAETLQHVAAHADVYPPALELVLLLHWADARRAYTAFATDPVWHRLPGDVRSTSWAQWHGAWQTAFPYSNRTHWAVLAALLDNMTALCLYLKDMIQPMASETVSPDRTRLLRDHVLALLQRVLTPQDVAAIRDPGTFLTRVYPGPDDAPLRALGSAIVTWDAAMHAFWLPVLAALLAWTPVEMQAVTMALKLMFAALPVNEAALYAGSSSDSSSSEDADAMDVDTD